LSKQQPGRPRSSSKRSSSKYDRRTARNKWIIIAMAVLMGLSLVAVPLINLLGDTTTAEPEVEDEDPFAEEEAAAEGPGPCGETPDDVPEVDSEIYDEPPEMSIDTDATYTATVETTCGDIQLELHAEAAPMAVNNLVNLAEDGYYEGVIVHRVVPGFVMQAGDPAGTGCGQDDCEDFDPEEPAYPGYSFDDELELAEELVEETRDEQLERLLASEEAQEEGLTEEMDEDELRQLVPAGYPRGTLAMANSGEDTNGSQFFITQGDPTQLEPLFTVFGTVVEGMDVVDDIVRSPADPTTGAPDEPPVILSVTIDEQ
jgi:cyclophilin family peptidyl-prolyl cis-trans isomerase